MGNKEERIRAITQLYYSKPEIQKALVEFSKDREVVPSYMMESFGKRPDIIQYGSDIMGLVKKGATSFHASEEIWNDALKLNPDMKTKEVNELRKGWDLLIDIDSKYLDVSKILTKLIVEKIENYGIINYGLKFSVSGDTPILIKSKNKISLTGIKEAIDLLKKGEKLQTLSLDARKKLVFSDVYDYLEHEDELYKVFHDQSTIPLKVTGHHSVFIFDKGEIVQKKVSDIKVGDSLITFNAKKSPLMSSKNNITHKFRFGKNQYSMQDITKKVKINKDLVRLVGYYLAEGHVTNIINQVGFSFNRNEKFYIEDCKKLLFKTTGRKISIRHPNKSSTQILIHSKEWASFFESVCGKKKNKHIPDFSWRLPKDLFLEMLLGYIRGDGYKIGKYSIVIKSVALQLIKELVWLCNLHGISCSISSKKDKPHILPQGNAFKGSFVYVLNIPKSELKIKEFFRDRNKFSPLPRDKTFPIEGLKLVYKQIKPKKFEQHRSEQMTLSKKKASLERIRKVINWFNEFKSKEFNKGSQIIMHNYESLFNSDIGIVGIKSIGKIGKKKVYDISVKDTESFFGNDYPILLHNSGNKGFHILVSGKAFPKEFNGEKMSDAFPKWPRAMCEYLMHLVRRNYNKEVSNIFRDIERVEEKIGSDSDKMKEAICPNCGRITKKGNLVFLKCPVCNMSIQRKNFKVTKKRLKCVQDDCAGILEVDKEEDFFECENCDNVSSINKMESFGRGKSTFTEYAKKSQGYSGELKEEYSGSFVGASDLILVAPRHLFRMPYSLHEKSSLASIVLKKDELDKFKPSDADPLKVKTRNFFPNNEENEGKRLLIDALSWKAERDKEEKETAEKKYEGKKYEGIELKNVSEDSFPPAINKLLKGLEEGRKRGLFVLITFLRSLNFSPDYINKKIREWNEKNIPPLKEGYVRSQIEWHLKQERKILPPNYNNDNFYKDLGLIDKKQKTKNPLVDVMRKVGKNREV